MGNVGRDPTEGLFAPVRVAGRSITGTTALLVSPRGGFESPATGNPEADSGHEEER